MRSREPYFVQAGYTIDHGPVMDSVDYLMLSTLRLLAQTKRSFTGAVPPVVSLFL